ncbi:MAG: radical SAM protein [Verrucomicrobiales bacterium]|nr:radical SAM protein [Verrucomicrobiales bacterium]
MSSVLVVSEIFLSIQGESTYAGLPCVFVRLAGCDLRCSYCDTAYAFSGGKRMMLVEVRRAVHKLARPFFRANARMGRLRLPLVELTGGEPLLQRASFELMRQLCDDGFVVLLETNGAHDISGVDPRVRRIVDIKCPSSGEAHRNRWENVRHLKRTDEVKFVIGTVQDYEWAKAQVVTHALARRCTVLFGWAHPLAPHQRVESLKPAPPDHTPLTQRELAERIIADALPVRFQVQLHKVIWPPDMRGV